MSCTASTPQTPSTANAVTPPTVIDEKGHAQSIFQCSICCEFSLDPVVTPCDHIFCRTCLQQSLRRNHFCPNDRKPLRASQLRGLDGPIKRVWSETPVKCPECQIWTGTLHSYTTEHAVVCVNPQKRIEELEVKLKEKEEELRTKTSAMQQHIQDLQQQLDTAPRQMPVPGMKPPVAHATSSTENWHTASKRPYEKYPDRHCASQAAVYGTNQHERPQPFYSSITGPFGPFGTQQQQQQPQPQLTFGQSSTIATAPSHHRPFGATAPFQVGCGTQQQQRRIIRARRPN